MRRSDNPPRLNTSKTAGRFASMHAVPWAVWVATSLVLCFGSAITWLAIAPVSIAHFRLTAKSEIVGIALVSRLELPIRAKQWFLAGVINAHAEDGREIQKVSHEVSLEPQSEGDLNSPSVYPTHIQITTNQGSSLVIRKREKPGWFRIEIQGGSAQLQIQVPTKDTKLVFQADDGRKNVETISGLLIAETSELGAIFDFLVPEDDSALAPPVKVTRFGFAVPRQDISNSKSVLPGLIEGRIQFLDTPTNELYLFPGSDIRFDGVSAFVDRLRITRDDIEMSVSGQAREVKLFVGDESRSLMPTRFESLRNDSRGANILVIMGGIFAVASAIFSAAPLVPHIKRIFGSSKGRK